MKPQQNRRGRTSLHPSPSTITEAYAEKNDWLVTPQAVAANRPLEEIERPAILATLEASAGNKSETARRLRINRKILHKKRKDYGINHNYRGTNHEH